LSSGGELHGVAAPVWASAMQGVRRRYGGRGVPPPPLI
jgi:hypothetical protein